MNLRFTGAISELRQAFKAHATPSDKVGMESDEMKRMKASRIPSGTTGMFHRGSRWDAVQWPSPCCQKETTLVNNFTNYSVRRCPCGQEHKYAKA